MEKVFTRFDDSEEVPPSRDSRKCPHPSQSNATKTLDFWIESQRCRVPELFSWKHPLERIPTPTQHRESYVSTFRAPWDVANKNFLQQQQS